MKCLKLLHPKMGKASFLAKSTVAPDILMAHTQKTESLKSLWIGQFS